ncbi:MAG: sulfite exporter TauE/SafE family protein [Clostridiales Family XIII bacterium]|jgi:sulfite exporter TauE/SafE/copper chaperone CopZ|nr:sulfite exporter TauE/SafE family protein [Clostridiales Family XIII bacterium]
MKTTVKGKGKVKKTRHLDLKIGGMYCNGCKSRIEARLLRERGIRAATVLYDSCKASIEYDPGILLANDIKGIIEKLGYRALPADAKITSRLGVDMRQLAGILIALAAVFMLFRNFGFLWVTGKFPLAEEGMSLGFIFVIGLLTGVHCVAMCGGINISQTLPTSLGDGEPEEEESLAGLNAAVDVAGGSTVSAAKRGPHRLIKTAPATGAGQAAKRDPRKPAAVLKAAVPSLKYNLGRVAGYTVVGAVVGGIGATLTFSGYFKGAVQLIAGVFMVIMGLSMFGVVPGLSKIAPRLPASLGRFIENRKNGRTGPFVVGVLSALMPCGPLQAMQLYALQSGSATLGALSMFVFSLGTLPLMFGFGALSGLLGGRFKGKAMVAGASFVILMGLFMFSNGANLSGLTFAFPGISGTPSAQAVDDGTTVTAANGEQIVNATLTRYGYPSFTVKKDVPVKFVLNAPEGSLTGCNSGIIIPSLGVEKRLVQGENVIEFTPRETGTIDYSCWMGMIRSSFTVEA